MDNFSAANSAETSQASLSVIDVNTVHPIVDLEEDEFTLKDPKPIDQEQYSLIPDMMFGWKPRILNIYNPIPLSFEKGRLPVCRDPITNEVYPTIYNGYWPKDSLKLQRAYKFPDTHGFAIN